LTVVNQSAVGAMKVGDGVPALAVEEITDTAARPRPIPRIVNRLHRVWLCITGLAFRCRLTHLVVIRSTYGSAQEVVT
jgi:hypothetical protein